MNVAEPPTVKRNPARHMSRWPRVVASDTGLLVFLAIGVFLLHTLTNGRYGFHRDELMALDDARHLDWGYVPYPPLTPFLGRVELELFGTSLRGFRFFAALAESAVLILAGLAAREMGGKRFASLVAALAVAVGGHSLFNGTFFQYTAFDYLWWMLVAYCVVRVLTSDDPRWWVAVGAAVGAGLMTKYTMAFLIAGIAAGALLTPARRHLRSPWLWFGAAVALFLWFPNLLWQYHHHFVSLDFLKSIHARDVAWGRASGFLPAQLWKCANPVTVPIWCAGLWYLFVTPAGKRCRMLGWMYVVPLVLLLAAKGRDYYLAAAYPMLLAVGAVYGEQWVDSLSVRKARAVRQITWRTLAVAGLCTAAVTLPLAPVDSRWWHVADSMNGNFNMQFGYREMVETVAKIRDGLPADDQARLGILAGDAGELGAFTLYGPDYGLPRAISGMNSAWLRGYGAPPPATLIVVGMHRDDLDRIFESCERVGHLTNRYGIENSAIDGYADVFLCKRLRYPWPEFWKLYQYYG